MDLCWQSNVSAFEYAIYVGHNFSSKEQACFHFMAAVTICSDFGVPENKVCHCFHCFPIYLPWSDGTGCHDLSFLNVEPQAKFSLSFFTFIKRLFSSFLLSAIRVVSSAHLRLLIFLLAILILACASSSQAFLMMLNKLNKQGDNIQPWRTPFPIWNQSVVPRPVLTVASRPAYRLLKRQVRWSGIPISKNFPEFVVVHTVKGFGTVNEAEVSDVRDPEQPYAKEWTWTTILYNIQKWTQNRLKTWI